MNDKLRLTHEEFATEQEPREFLSWVGRERKTGRLTMDFIEGGLRRPIKWREKAKEKQKPVS